MTQKRLLLIDDQAEMWEDDYSEDLLPHGFVTSIEISPDNAIKSIRNHNPDVILLDLHFPGDDLDDGGVTTGAKLLGLIQHEFPHLPVVVFTDKMGDDRLTLDTMNPQRYYAKEKIEQLIDTGMDWAADLAITLGQAIADLALQTQRPEKLDAEMGFVVGKSSLMQEVVRTIREVAGNAITVLIEGETGTGKELVARAIHHLSGRKILTTFNCSGVHEETLEDKLFGHEKGAFTGANWMKKGLFEQSAGGTVFLDEIQAMPSSLQNKLIRVVQDKIIQRMGGVSDITVDVRLVVATNKPAQELVADGLLRQDLYFRLNTLIISLPSLRERVADIPLLWPALVEKANKGAGKTVMTMLRKEVRDLLEQHTWPGNIRELENVISSAVVKARSNILFPQDIDLKMTPNGLSDKPLSAKGNVVAQVQNSFEVVEPRQRKDTSEEMDRLTQLPAIQRWESLMANTAGDSRNSVLVEIVRKVREPHPSRRVTAKELTEFLCGEEGHSREEKEKFKKNYDKVRAMLSSLNIQLTKLDCNQ